MQAVLLSTPSPRLTGGATFVRRWPRDWLFEGGVSPLVPPARDGADVCSGPGFLRDQRGGKLLVTATLLCHLKLPLFAG